MLNSRKKHSPILALAFLLAIILVYVVMASQFQSFIDPFIIMFTVPLGIAGVLWMLVSYSYDAFVTSFQGVIVMVGIVVSNGILLVDYTNHLAHQWTWIARSGRNARSKTRLKPILMTSPATVPDDSYGHWLGGESTQAPLAIAVIRWIDILLLVNALLCPILYTIFEERFKREIEMMIDVQTEGSQITGQTVATTELPSIDTTTSDKKDRNS